MRPDYARFFSRIILFAVPAWFILHFSGKLSSSADTYLLIFMCCILFIDMFITELSNRRSAQGQPWTPGQDLEFNEKVEEKIRASSNTPESQQSGYKITLESSGRTRLQVIRVMRMMFTLGLKEAKDFVESAPQLVKQNAAKAEADYIKQQLEQEGAVVKVEKT
jgi:ribosomal protein L7/L12